MKRFFIYLSVLASVAFGVSACVDQVFPKGTDPTPVVKASDIDITISDVKDSSFTATITPKAEGKYYSYLIVDSASMAGKKVDSMSVYKCSYDGLVVGCKESVKGASTTVKLEDLDPNRTYIVYAVNSSTEGNVSRLAQAKVKTSDTVAPFITKWSFEENEVSITYSEPVQWDKTKEISYGVWYKANLLGTPQAYKVVTDSVIVDGAEVTIVCKKAVHTGAAYNLNFPEGTFTDVVGNPCAALVSKFTKLFDFTAEDLDEEFFNCFPSTEGSICGVLENGDLEYEITTPIPQAVKLSDIGSLKIDISIPNWIRSFYNSNSFVTVYNRTTESKSKVQETVTMKMGADWCPNTSTYASIWFKPAGTPQNNDVFTIVIPAESIRDTWGDVNAEEIKLGPITVIDPHFEFVDPKIGCNNVYATAKTDCDVYYYWDFCENVQDSTDEDLIANAKAYIQDYADYYEMSFADFYEQYMASQGNETVQAKYLDAETDYKGSLYAFFMTTDGTVMSPVYKQENFKTVKFEMPTAATGSYLYNKNSLLGGSYLIPGLPIEYTKGLKDTIIIRNAGYDSKQTYKFAFNENGRAVLQTTKWGLDWPAQGGEVYIGECLAIAPKYASFQTYYDQVKEQLNIGCVYFTETKLLNNYSDQFWFNNSKPASPSSVKSAVTNNVKLSKYIALPEKELRRHAPRR